MSKNTLEPILSSRIDENLSPNPVARVLSSGSFFWVVVLITTLIAIGLGALSANRRNFSEDEVIYVRLIKVFDSDLSFELLRTYNGEPASPAPLFFLVYAGWGKLFGFSYTAFRILSLLLTLLAMLCIWLFLYKYTADESKYFFPVLLFLYPYIFCMSFSVMAEPLTLLFSVIGLCCYIYGLKEKSSLALFFGSIAIAAALHVRIHAIFACGALIAVLLLQKDLSPLKWFLAVLPVLARLPLVFFQGGLTVSRQAFTSTKPELGFCLSNVNFFLVVLGYMFLPLLWWAYTRHRSKLLVTLALIPFYFLVCPDFLASTYKGALRTLFIKLGTEPAYVKLILFLPWLIGCYIMVDIIRRILYNKDITEKFLCACIVMFMAQLIFSTVAFERYYQLAAPAIILLGVKRTDRTSGYIVFACWHFFFLALAFARLLKDVV